MYSRLLIEIRAHLLAPMFVISFGGTPNEGLEPYRDEAQFYVGQVITDLRINLCFHLSDKERKHSYRQ